MRACGAGARAPPAEPPRSPAGSPSIHPSAHPPSPPLLPADAYLPFAFAALSWGPGMVSLVAGIISELRRLALSCCAVPHALCCCAVPQALSCCAVPQALADRVPPHSLTSPHPPSLPPPPPAVTWYASILLSSLHEWNGVRYLRYSDLAESIHGALEGGPARPWRAPASAAAGPEHGTPRAPWLTGPVACLTAQACGRPAP